VRTPQTNAALESTLTRQRLDKYLARSNNDLDTALRLYEENARLSEAFYTPLQSLEVCLRNCLHVQMANVYGVDWLQNGAPGFNTESTQMIADAIFSLRNQPQPATPGGIVAELKFAFWVGLVGPHYDATLWRRALHRAFRAAGGQRRSTVHGRLNAVRRFRNRVMHHEPIFHRPLQQIHDEIIEAVAWMCSETSAWTAHHSRFDQTLSTVGP
jgi:hypothetical protein